MNTKNRNLVSAVVLYLVVPLFVNCVYFIGYNSWYPDCSNVCLVFFNLAWVSTLLPLLLCDRTEEKSHKGGQRIIASVYFFVELVMAICLLFNDASFYLAMGLQLLLFVSFILAYFCIDRANIRSSSSMKRLDYTKSPSLKCVNDLLRLSIGEYNNPEQRELLRTALSELSATPQNGSPELEELDRQILESANNLASNPTNQSSANFSRLLYKRRTIAMLSLK